MTDVKESFPVKREPGLRWRDGPAQSCLSVLRIDSSSAGALVGPGPRSGLHVHVLGVGPANGA